MRWIIILLGFLIFVILGLGCTKDVEKEQDGNGNILEENNRSNNPLLTTEENRKMDILREKRARGVSITTQEQCEAEVGRWQQEPMEPYPGKWFCNLPTTDAGKSCMDDSECEGVCIVPLSDEEIYEVAHSRGDLTLTPLERIERQRKLTKKILSKYKEGSCSEWIVNDYCLYKFYNGRIEGCPLY